MPHASHTHFTASSKPQILTETLSSAQALLSDQRNWIANTANVASLLWHAYAAIGTPVNWSGFYVRDARAASNGKEELILGPFMGRVACQVIPFGRGVCGVAAREGITQVVANVDDFPGHIACDGASKSEIVVPIIVNEKTVAIIDIDCTETNGFDEVDREYLEKLAQLLSESCDW